MLCQQPFVVKNETALWALGQLLSLSSPGVESCCSSWGTFNAQTKQHPLLYLCSHGDKC